MYLGGYIRGYLKLLLTQLLLIPNRISVSITCQGKLPLQQQDCILPTFNINDILILCFLDIYFTVTYPYMHIKS